MILGEVNKIVMQMNEPLYNRLYVFKGKRKSANWMGTQLTDHIGLSVENFDKLFVV